MPLEEVREGGVLMGYSEVPAPKPLPKATPVPQADRWSEADEAKFKEMQARRERVQNVRREALHNAMAGALMYIGRDGDAWDLLNSMIANADSIRDALAPYDSGTRPANPHIDC